VTRRVKVDRLFIIRRHPLRMRKNRMDTRIKMLYRRASRTPWMHRCYCLPHHPT